MATTDNPGFFGKLPSHGDFLNRRIQRSFLDNWDNWLQKAVARSREQLESEWLDTYLTSPIWRFVLGSGVCGDQPFAGVLMPSVDKVGRYFPLTISVPIPKGYNILQLPKDLNDWFDTAEKLALSALDEPFDLEDFDRKVEQLDVPVSITTGGASSSTSSTISTHSSGKSTHINIPSNNEMVGPYLNTLNHLFNVLYQNYSLWWTTGSNKVKPCLLSCSGLPPVDGYAAFLDGRWALWGWQQQEESSIVFATQSTQESAATPLIPEDWEYPV